MNAAGRETTDMTKLTLKGNWNEIKGKLTEVGAAESAGRGPATTHDGTW
ncbi:MAG TPA: hypothetical protein VIS96_11695 [Terrimicrobiaceae bacterium]